MPDETGKPEAPPLPKQHGTVPAAQNMPTPQVAMSATRANRIAWAAIVLALVGIVASGLSGAGWLPVKAMQVCGTIALICQAVSWYLARLSPSMNALKAAQQNGHKEVQE